MVHTSKVVNSIPVGKSPGNSPNGIGINSINDTVYTINSGSNTVSVINGTNNSVKGYLLGFFNSIRGVHMIRIMMRSM